MVFPSRPVGEGMPGVLIEAGLSGVPVVATDVPGVSTIVADGETGTVVPADDPAAMVEAVAVLLDDAALRSAMGHAARHRCIDRFSLDAVADVWLQRLGPLVAEVPAPPAERDDGQAGAGPPAGARRAGPTGGLRRGRAALRAAARMIRRWRRVTSHS